MKNLARALLPLLVLAACLACLAHAQTAPLATGSVSGVTELPNNGLCPSGFYSNQNTPAICYSATLSCPSNAYDITLTYSVDTPNSPVRGTIVLFSGGGGTSASTSSGQETTFANDYFNLGYQVVQVQWGSDWENATLPPNPLQHIPAYNVLNAACRPATFLNYVHNNIYSTGGMCAQGASAGSGAVAYSLVWYGAGSYLNNVELLSGPVFGDIELGCQVPFAGNANICSQNPTPQYGCSPGTVTEVNTSAWLDALQYIDHYATEVQSWTGDSSCANINNTQTSSQSNTRWKQMSVVNGTGGNFGFSTTGAAGWMCYSYMSGTCTSQTSCPNNSAAEGEQFYGQFTSTNHPLAYLVTGIQLCDGAEKVGPGTDPDPVYGGQAGSGKVAIEQHMTNNCH